MKKRNYLSARFWSRLAVTLDSAAKERPTLRVFSAAATVARTLAVLADMRDARRRR